MSNDTAGISIRSEDGGDDDDDEEEEDEEEERWIPTT